MEARGESRGRRRGKPLALALVGAVALVAVLALLLRAPAGSVAGAVEEVGDASVADSAGLASPEVEVARSRVALPGADLGAPPSPGPPAGPSVVLVVMDPDRNPIAGAEVRKLDDPAAGVYAANERGECPLPVAASDSFQVLVHVTSPGFDHHLCEYSGSPPETEGEPHRIDVPLSPIATVHGLVVNRENGRPVPGADVRLERHPCEFCATPATRTDALGQFEVAGIPTVEAELAVRAEGFVPKTHAFAIRDPDKDSTLEIALAPGLPVWLEVVDYETGQAVGDAVVERAPARIEAGPDGRVLTRELLAVGEAEATIQISAPGRCSLSLPLGAEEAVGLLRVPLPRSAVLQGIARDTSGAPVPGVFVTTSNKHEEVSPSPLHDVRPGWQYTEADWMKQARTGIDGTFTIDCFLPWSRETRLDYRHGGKGQQHALQAFGGPASVQWVDLVVAEDVLGPTGTIVGRLLLNGEPAMGTINWKGATRKASTETEGGLFRIEDAETGTVVLSPRLGRIDQRKCPEIVSRRSVEVIADQVTEVELAYTHLLATISGWLHDSEGAPVEGASVWARGEGNCWTNRALTADDGSWTLEVSAHVAAYEIFGGRDDRAWLDGVRPGEQGVRLAYPRKAPLDLKVIAADTGLALEGLEVEHKAPGEPWEQGAAALDESDLPDPGGWYRLRLEPGRYDLGISLRRKHPDYMPIEVDGVLVEEHGARLLLEAERGHRLELALAEGLEPWPSETLVLLLESERFDSVAWQPGGGITGFGMSDVLHSRYLSFEWSRGAIFRGLAPGRYRLRSFPPGLTFEPAEIEVGIETNAVELSWSSD